MEAPLRWNPFFQQLADPKTALQPLTEMHPPMFKNEECRSRRRTPAPLFQCCWKQPQQSLHPHQKSPSACTTLKVGGAWGGLSSNPTYITMFAPLFKHCLIVIQSVQAREYFQNQAMVANFNLLDTKLMKNGPSRTGKCCLGKMWKRLDHD